MTAETLAAALLRDVERYPTFNGRFMYEDAVLAALSRALDPALTDRAGEVVADLRNDADWGTPICTEAADLIADLLAQNAWLKANVEAGDLVNGLEKNRAEAAEAKVERLTGALQRMPLVVRHTTVCQGPSWPDDRPGVWIAALTACENAVQEAVDAALTTEERHDG